jgi:hypothetical protein
MKALTVLLAALALALGASSATAAPPPAEFQDPAGDSGPGPDITKVAVSANDAGTLTLRIEIPNRPTVPPGFALTINLDADTNIATGSPDASGADYLIVSTDTVSGLGRWNGSTFEPVQGSSVGSSYSGGVTLTVNASDIGAPESFRFWVGTWDDVDDPNNWDAAPGSGFFSYSLRPGGSATTTAPSIEGVEVLADVRFPKAGKVLSARSIRLRLTDSVVSPETMQCTLKLAGKTVRPLAGGCKWRIPMSAKGKRGTLKVTLTYKGQSVTETVPVRVRA